MGFVLHVKLRIYQVFSGDYVKFRIYQVFSGVFVARLLVFCVVFFVGSVLLVF